MPYRFVVNYPQHLASNGNRLHQLQHDILHRFPQCRSIENFYSPDHEADYHSTVYEADTPQDIAQVATALKNADAHLFIGLINRDSTDIYYHPVELSKLNPVQKAYYKFILAHLPHMERVIHDYLSNLYHQVPTSDKRKMLIL